MARILVRGQKRVGGGGGKVYICPMFGNVFIVIKRLLRLSCFVVHPVTTECTSSPLRCSPSASRSHEHALNQIEWMGFRVPRCSQWEGEGPSNHVTAIYRHIVQVISDQLVEHPQIAFNGARARVWVEGGQCVAEICQRRERDLKVVNRVAWAGS